MITRVIGVENRSKECCNVYIWISVCLSKKPELRLLSPWRSTTFSLVFLPMRLSTKPCQNPLLRETFIYRNKQTSAKMRRGEVDLLERNGRGKLGRFMLKIDFVIISSSSSISQRHLLFLPLSFLKRDLQALGNQGYLDLATRAGA